MNSPTNSQACVVLVTAPSQEEAKKIAGALVEERLAACVTLFQVESVYRWEGTLCNDPEWQLMVKTQVNAFPELERRVRELHSYDVPEIIALPITAGSLPYLTWIANESGE